MIFCFLFPSSSKIVKSLNWVDVQPSITYESIKNTRLILQNQIPKPPFPVSVHLVEPPFVLKFSHHFVHYLIKQLSELHDAYIRLLPQLSPFRWYLKVFGMKGQQRASWVTQMLLHSLPKSNQQKSECDIILLCCYKTYKMKAAPSRSPGKRQQVDMKTVS